MHPSSYVCRECLQALRAGRASQLRKPLPLSRSLSGTQRILNSTRGANTPDTNQAPSQRALEPSSSLDSKPPDPEAELGPMARRLQEATEDAMLTGGRAGRRAVEDAGFSEELKERLLNKIADAQFRSDNSTAFAKAGLGPSVPSSAGQGTRDIASGQAWTGEEATADTILRMLDDAHKPLAPGLRGKPRAPEITPRVVDMRLRREPVLTPGQRAASARDRATVYAGMGFKDKDSDQGLSSKEKDAMRQEFRDSFTPGARAMPNSMAGLAALANERIEDAIARGQFKNIPRGKGIERDTRADNPFVDTTEYIMNKMIKRQDMVPPWIEKQQDLVKAARVFRVRLRKDWTRHAARIIASRGGSLEEQMRRANEYARAEEVHNPRKRNVDEIAVASNATDDVVMAKMRQPVESNEAPSPTATASGEPLVTLSSPFRDPTWEATERSYMELTVANLNAMTRSYNLMAPELAKKPYFSLERELNSCFADVAPQLAAVIKERASKPTRPRADPFGRGTRGVLDRFGIEGKSARVYDSKEPHYGFKEMWRDFWGPQA